MASLEKRTLREQREYDVLKGLNGLQLGQYDALKRRVSARIIQVWYRQKRRERRTISHGFLPPGDATVMRRSTVMEAGDEIHQLENLRARMQSLAMLKGTHRPAYGNMVSATKAVTEALGTGWKPHHAAVGVDLAVPSELTMQQARLVELRKKTLDLLNDKYAREIQHGSPQEVAQRRQDMIVDFESKLAKLCNPPQLRDLLPTREVTSLRDAGAYRADIEHAFAVDPRLQWDRDVTEMHKEYAIAENAASLCALRADKNWWHAYSVEAIMAQDVRDAHQQWPWIDDIPQSRIKSGEAGWKSLQARQSLPPDFSLPRDAAVVETSVHDTLHVSGLAGAADLLRGSTLHDIKDKRTVLPSDTSVTTPKIDQSGYDTRIDKLREEDASDWWLAYSCSSAPKYTDHLGDKAREPHRQVTTELFEIDEAMKRLAVVDPWSTSVARIDPVHASREAHAALSLEPEAGPDVDAIVSQSQKEARRMHPGSLTDEDLLSLDMQLAAMPALDYFVVPDNGQSAGESMQYARRIAGKLVRTAALAKPAESIAARAKLATEVIRKKVGGVEDLLELPGSMNLLMREVAARKIQHTWRGAKLIRAARRLLAEKLQAKRASKLSKLALVQDAMIQFCRVLEHTAGVELGVPDFTSSLQLGGATTTSANVKPSDVQTTQARMHGQMDVEGAVGTLLATALSSVSRGTLRAAQETTADTLAPSKMATKTVSKPPPRDLSVVESVPATMNAPAPRPRLHKTYLSYSSISDVAPAPLPLQPKIDNAEPTTSTELPEWASAFESLHRYRTKPDVSSAAKTDVPPSSKASATTAAESAAARTSNAYSGLPRPLVAFPEHLMESLDSDVGLVTAPPRTNSSSAELLDTAATFGSGTMIQNFTLAVDPRLLLPTKSRYE